MCKIDINENLSDTKKMYMQFIIDQEQKDSTIENAHNFLVRLQEYEENLMDGKDAKDFSYEEVVNYLSYLQSTSAHSLRMYATIINSYIAYCKREYLTRNTLDFSMLLTTETLEEYLDKDKQQDKYVTYDRYKELVEQCDYWCEKAVIMMLWHIGAGKEYRNLTDLKYSDLDFDSNTITVHDEEGEERVIVVGADVMRVLKKTESETQYNKHTFRPSNYVFRNLESVRCNEDKMSKVGMMNRIRKIKLSYDWGYVVADDICKGGTIYRMMKEFNIVNAEDYLARPHLKPRLADFIKEDAGLKAVAAYRVVRDFEVNALGIEPTSATSIRGRGRVKG